MTAAFLLAGCAADSPAGDPLAEEVVAPATAGERSFGFSGSGPGGGFFVAYLPLQGRPDSAEIEYRMHVSAPGGEVLAWPPSLTRVHEGTESVSAPPFLERLLHPAGAADIDLESGYASSTSAAFGGVLFAFAAEAAWNATVSVRSSTPLGSPFVVEGANATFAGPSQRRVEVPVLGSGPVDEETLSFEVDAPGWTHVELATRKVMPDGVRDQEFRFPNGFVHEGLGYQEGYDLVVMGSAGSGGWVDAAGAMQDEPGTVSARVLHAETRYGHEFLAVHMPLPPAALAGISGDYVATLWPFNDDLPVAGQAPRVDPGPDDTVTWRLR